ncbi:MAG: hypothetical protein V7605_1432 [Acidimicrobiaceae bacterium]
MRHRSALGFALTLGLVLAAGVLQTTAPAATAAAAAAAIINVPTDQPTVQAGIDAGSPGTRVVVAPGVYHEHIDFHGKAVEVASAQGPATTILDGDQGAGAVVTFTSGEGRGSILRGFTVRNGQDSGVQISHASPTVTGNVVSANLGSGEGGGINVYFGSPLIEANHITGNGQSPRFFGGSGGGGIGIQGAGAAEVVGNTIDHNSWGSVGGAIGINADNVVTLKDNVIRDNSVPSVGGAVSLINDNNVTFVDNLFVANHAGHQGGAVYVTSNRSGGGPYFIANTMVANTAAEGSALYLDDQDLGEMVVADNVIVGPTGGAVTCNARRGMFATPTFSHNDVFDGTRLPYAGCGNPTGLSGNINVDPHLVNASASAGDYRLSAGSPAIDAGDNAAPALPSADLSGQPRIADGDGDGVGAVDIGAYESPGPRGAAPGPAPPDPLPPAEIHVPTDQPTIQAGIDRVASNGGMVTVAAGTYRENIDFHGKAVKVTSVGGPASTVIDGGDKDTVVSIVSGEGRSSVLEGFTIRNGGGSPIGGGIYIGNSAPTITGNVVTHNLGAFGVGIQVYWGAALIQDNSVSDNHQIQGSSGGRGGGVSLLGDARAEVVGNLIENNSDSAGGGMSISGAGAVVRDNTIRRNSALNEGGGVIMNATDVAFTQNLVVDNSASERGGGMYGTVRATQGASVVNNTFAANRSAGGSAVWSFGFEPDVVVDNNVMAGPAGATVLECEDLGWYTTPAIPQFSHNDVYNGDAQPVAGCATVVGTNANISSDPRFVEPSPVAPDYHLQPASPVIDAGNDTAPSLPPVDLDGRPRVVDGDGDGAATIDMGAFEAAGPGARSTGWSWGWDRYGQLGDGGTDVTRTSPGPQAGSDKVVAESAGYLHSLALQADGTVRASGWNAVGQVGDSTTTDRTALVPVQGLSDVVQVAAGGAHSLALRSDGTVWAWGWNGVGQLGDGTTVDRMTPVQVPGLSGVVAVSAGTFHSLALEADGTVWAWGWNSYGQLGDGTTLDRHRPMQVSGLSGVRSIAAGGLHTVVATDSGDVWAWGLNGVGELGTGSIADSHAPVRVPGLAGVVGVSAGLFHSMAVKADGTAWAWGWNAYGQLGDGTTDDRHLPVRAATGTRPVRLVAAGAYHSLFLRDDATVAAAGWNGVGQLGDATTVDRHTPVPVAGLGPVTAISAGFFHSVAS